MTNDNALWTALHDHLPRQRWVPIGDIYLIVQHRVPLDTEDLKYRTSHSSTPQWKFNVRRILRSKQREGRLLRRMRP